MANIIQILHRSLLPPPQKKNDGGLWSDRGDCDRGDRDRGSTRSAFASRREGDRFESRSDTAL